jgi:hypothetical protein
MRDRPTSDLNYRESGYESLVVRAGGRTTTKSIKQMTPLLLLYAPKSSTTTATELTRIVPMDTMLKTTHPC